MIGSAYNYYLAQYGNYIARPYTTHKKSELRAIYNSIIRINRNSPLYKIKDSSDVRSSAINLKEASAALINIVSSLSDGEGFDFTSKQAYSSDKSIIDVKYIDIPDNDNGDGEAFDIIVDSLATPQVNESFGFASHSKSLPDGEYSFDLNIGEYTYEFQFSINEDDTDRSVLEKLARLFNRSNTGIKADVITEDFSTSALRLTGTSTGRPDGKERSFFITPADRTNVSDTDISIVDILGLNNTSQFPEDASFSINGQSGSSTSNILTIGGNFHLTLYGTSDGRAIRIGFKEDIDSAVDNISSIADAYNRLLDISANGSGSSFEASRLYRELTGISETFKTELEAAGMIPGEDGRISADKALITQSFNEGKLNEALDNIAPFNDMLLKKAYSINLNPMGYVDKKMITYPNPYGSFAAPYSASLYSGIMFNGYV